MKKNSFLFNKYTIAVFILLAYVAVDAILHKGMCRVLIGGSFNEQLLPVQTSPCNNPLEVKDKAWTKAVNTTERLNNLRVDAAGFEMDVYYDTARNGLLLFHDSTEYSTLPVEAVLHLYVARKMTASIWLDFKNLSPVNETAALQYIVSLRDRFGLSNRLIVESSMPQCLVSFCRAGFFTSYYTPFFNPYQQDEAVTQQYIDSIQARLIRYPVSALSGYYFQYPLLKKYFPAYPLLTWADDPNSSVVSYFFNRKLFADGQLKVILHPGK